MAKTKKCEISFEEMQALVRQNNQSAMIAEKKYQKISEERGIPIIYIQGSYVTCEDDLKKFG